MSGTEVGGEGRGTLSVSGPPRRRSCVEASCVEAVVRREMLCVEAVVDYLALGFSISEADVKAYALSDHDVVDGLDDETMEKD